MEAYFGNKCDMEFDRFDSLCAICDNGGQLICCEGKCFRSFHATPNLDEAEDFYCETLCLTAKEMAQGGPYKCESCKYSLHQCFVCAQLGSSDKSLNTEVFRCSVACRHFYHPKCVAKLVEKNDKAKQEALKEKIAAGAPFICPAHVCAVCKKTEDETVVDLQFAICRRCPKSYHRKCLPSGIVFDHLATESDEVRGWNGLLPKSRALIYCMDHEIDPELLSPARPVICRNILNRETSQLYKRKVAANLTDDSSEHMIEARFKNLYI